LRAGVLNEEEAIFEKGLFPSRTMIARVYRQDPLEEGGAGLKSIELDGIDEKFLEGDLTEIFLERRAVGPFGLLRVVATPADFTEDAPRRLEVGDWLRLTLYPGDGPKRITAEHAQLTEGGYTVGSRGYVGDIEFLGDDGEPPLRSVGASVAKRRKRAQKAINGGIFPASAVVSLSGGSICRYPRQPTKVQVRDVGQAGFVTLLDKHDWPILHFDAGWPVSFNGHTAPASTTVPNVHAPVVLSHWDWDHLHGYYVFPDLQLEPWFTPVQKLGPGASRVAAQLLARGLLFGITGGPFSFGAHGWARLAVCAGPANNKNQTGLALEARVASRDGIEEWVLMTGDADYHHAITALGTANAYAGLVVAHHGATFSGLVPPPTGRGRAAVSYGEANTYGHPSLTALLAHASWTLERTANHLTVVRGCRYLP